MYCSKCGNKIDENAKVCAQCGAPVAGTKSFLADKKISPQHKKIIIIVVSIIAVLGLAKLMVKSPEESLVGTWVCTEDDEWFLTFNDNGTFYDSDSILLDYVSAGTWMIPSDGILYLDSPNEDGTYNFELKRNELIIYWDSFAHAYRCFRRSK